MLGTCCIFIIDAICGSGIFCAWVCLLFLFLFLFYLDYIPGHKLLRKSMCVFSWV